MASLSPFYYFSFFPWRDFFGCQNATKMSEYIVFINKPFYGNCIEIFLGYINFQKNMGSFDFISVGSQHSAVLDSGPAYTRS